MEQPLPFINFYGKKVNASVEDKKANRLILDEAGVWNTNNIENKNKFKTMTDYAIHSPNDGELLIKFHDELVKKGFFTDAEWNKYNNPNTGLFALCIPHDIDTSIFYSYSGNCYKVHHTLTPSNFQTVLNEVLQNFGIEYKD